MNSFSKLSKLEIIEQLLDSVTCGVPLLFGLFISSASYNEENNVEILTDIEPLYDYITKIVKNIAKNYKKIQEKQKQEIKPMAILDEIVINGTKTWIDFQPDLKIIDKTFYKITLTNPLLSDVFSLYKIEENKSLSDNTKLVSKSIDEIKGFVKGIYLGAATSSIKISKKPNEKTSSGYHMEFISKNINLLRELSHILAQFDIYAKLITRKNNYVLYLKDADHVSDLLALIGANNSVLTLKNEIVKREFRNKINRQTNCLSGNISKTVEASIKQLQAIDKIEKEIGLSTLPSDLEEVALMRLANPEETLSTLLKLSGSPLTKSGLNHRLRKIISIADKL